MGAVPMRVASAEDAVGQARAACDGPCTNDARCSSTCPWTCRPSTSPTSTRPAPAATAATAAEPSADEVVGVWLEVLEQARRPVFVAGTRCAPPGARDALEAPRRPLRRPARDLGRGARAVPRQPVVARRLRRLRLAAGGRTHRRGRPDRRLGLRAEHVDDAARRAHRCRTRPSCRSTTTPRHSARTGSCTSGSPAMSNSPRGTSWRPAAREAAGPADAGHRRGRGHAGALA